MTNKPTEHIISIETEAETYIANLFEQQGDSELALKIDVEKAGTPMAVVTFNFCRPQELNSAYQQFTYQGFDAYVNEHNFEALHQANISLKSATAEKKLTIYAPNAKGKAPNEDAPLAERIAYTIAAEINPQLAAHGGFAELIEITDNMNVILNFGGGCQGCSSVKQTLKHGIENQLKLKYPEIKEVRDVTDHSNTENAFYK